MRQIPINDFLGNLRKQLTKHNIERYAIRKFERLRIDVFSEFCKRKNVLLVNLEVLNDFSIYVSKVNETPEILFNFSKKLFEFYTTGIYPFTKRYGMKTYVPENPKHIEIFEDLERQFPNRALKAAGRSFFCFIESRNIGLENINDQVFIDFMNYRSQINKSCPHINLKVTHVISSFLNKLGYIQTNIDFSLYKPRRSRTVMIKPFTEDEMKKLFIASKTGKNPKRNHAIFMIAATTGLRGVDILKIKIDDIHWDKKELFIIQGKNLDQLEIPLNTQVMNTIADYILNERPVCKYKEIFLEKTVPPKPLTRPDSVFRAIARNASIEHVKQRGFHSIRRTFASTLSAKQIPLTNISQLLGHKNINHDRPYLSYDAEKMNFCALDFSEIPCFISFEEVRNA